MAHQIFQDRRMFFAGETPWHGLGTRIPENAQWSDIAPMFPEVHEQPIVMNGGVVIPDKKALISSDDGRYLATVGADYHVVQAETIGRAIVEAAAGEGAVFHTGGLLGERGARGWLLGELPRANFRVDGDNSEVKAYFLGYWGHDGSTAVQLRNVATRVVCQNTVSAALGERGNFRLNVRHTSGATDAVVRAGQSFAALYAQSMQLRDFGNKYAAVRTTREQVQAALDSMFPVSEDMSDRQRESRDQSQAKVVELLQGPTVAPAHRGTAWGLMQAMSEFSEHYAARMTDAQKQINAIAERAIDMSALANVYSHVIRATGA